MGFGGSLAFGVETEYDGEIAGWCFEDQRGGHKGRVGVLGEPAGALLDRCQYLWGNVLSWSETVKGPAEIVQSERINGAMWADSGSKLGVFLTRAILAHLFLFKERLRPCASAKPVHIRQFLARPAVDWLRISPPHFWLPRLASASLQALLRTAIATTLAIFQLALGSRARHEIRGGPESRPTDQTHLVLPRRHRRLRELPQGDPKLSHLRKADSQLLLRSHRRLTDSSLGLQRGQLFRRKI